MPTDLPMHRVAADMERIFRPLAERAPSPSTTRSRAVAPVVARKRRLPLVAGAIVLGICGLAIGYGRDDRAPRAGVTASAPATRPAPPVTTEPLPTETPIAQLALAPPPPASFAEEEEEEEEAPARGDEAARAAIPTPRPRPVVVRRASPVERRCEPGSDEDLCIYQDVLAADDRLRHAYDRAVDAGVDPARLAAIQRRWTRVRRGADEDPDGTIDRYHRLADALDEARR